MQASPIRETPHNASAAMWAHLAPLCTLGAALIFFPLMLFYWVGPLVIRNSYKNDPFVRHHSTQALNETLTGLCLFLVLLIIGVVGFVSARGGTGVAVAAVVVVFIAALLVFALAIIRIVFGIVASVKAHRGERFPLPLWIAFRFVKDDTAAS
jgi:uncharacterized Tic20 family protein